MACVDAGRVEGNEAGEVGVRASSVCVSPSGGFRVPSANAQREAAGLAAPGAHRGVPHRREEAPLHVAGRDVVGRAPVRFVDAQRAAAVDDHDAGERYAQSEEAGVDTRRLGGSARQSDNSLLRGRAGASNDSGMTTTTAPASLPQEHAELAYPRPPLRRARNARKEAAPARALREAGYSPTLIRDLPNGDRPRERLRDAGAWSLSNAELLAILLRTGTQSESVLDIAERLLAKAQGLDGLARLSHAELCKFHGFGEAKASQLLAAIELGKRITSTRVDEKPVIRSPHDVEKLLRNEMAFLDQEHFRVIALDTKNRVLSMSDIAVGTVNSTTIRTAEVFREAVQRNAPAIIVAHNHPSGDSTPSREDIVVTRELMKAAKHLDIELMDHIVVARSGVSSLKEMRALTAEEGA